MYSEILKIIEAGLKNDPQKVQNYSTKLGLTLQENGQINVAKKINKLIQTNATRTAKFDSLTTKPFDAETHVDIVDVSIPSESTEELFFDDFIEKQVTEFLKTYAERDKLIQLGIDSNNHLLLYGAPGTGKTSLAKFISLQTNLPLVTARLDGIVSSLLGSTAKNIRKVFDFASKQPCILFLDEFDVLAKVRDDKHELGELKRVVNSLIQNIDGFDSDSILIAATNHPQLLDQAVWRRFDTRLKLDLPQADVREKLIKFYSKIMPNDYTKDEKKLTQVVDATNGIAPSGIKTIINSAAKNTILSDQKSIKFSRIILEIFIYKAPDDFSETNAIRFMINNSVSQREIADQLSVSMRIVRTIYKGVKNNGK